MQETITLPEEAYTDLVGARICRLLNGMWQMSGTHGTIRPEAAIENMFDYHASGFVTWDLADHYGRAEEFIGQFRRRLAFEHGDESLEPMSAFTKWVPRPGPMGRQKVAGAVKTSLERMNVDQLDMLQFHWWDYHDPRYLDALQHMVDLQAEGLINMLGLTNFDTQHMRIIVLENGIPIVSNQVQYSLIDMRPRQRMARFCLKHGIKLLTYGTVAGGFLSERFVGQPEPQPYQLNTASLRKYKGMIDIWGGWQLLQDLLQVLRDIADKHNVSIANVAVRSILAQPEVAGVIIGARLGISDRRVENAKVFSFQLDDEDWAAIDSVQARSHDLLERIGDCGDEYRRRL